MPQIATMRSMLLCAMALLVSQAAVVAQEKEAPKPDLLRQYLGEKDEAARKDLRAKLIALGAVELQSAISKLSFAKPNDLGALEFETKCPDGFTRPYFMHVPPKYDAAKSYPIIVWLHGGVAGAPAEAASEAIMMWEQALGEKWSEEVMVLAPAAIAGDTSEEAVWYRDAGQRNVLHMLKDARLRFNIDDSRVFLTGMSDGGSGSFGFACRRPDTFAGYFPMVGHPLIPAMVGTPMFWENFGGSKVYAISGGKDRLYPAAMVAKLIDEANKNGASIEHKIYPEAGHDLSYAADEMPKILDMVAKWQRELALAEIDWSSNNTSMGRRSWLQITELADLGDKNAKDLVATPRTGQARVMLGITINPESEPTDPVVVESVAEGSVAESIGIEVGDTITKFDGAKTGNLMELRAALDKKNLGDEFSVTLERGGVEKTIKGKFPTPKPMAADLMARVKAVQKPLKAKDEKGSVHGTLFELSVTNASKLTLYLTAEQVKLGKAVVSINGGEGIVFEKLAEDAETVLAEFERYGDRKSPFVAKIEINVAKQLGVKVKPLPKEEDDDGEGF